MEDSFNPYQQWLGIPPQEQPPHHYRLLGIKLFEGDSDVIARAARNRMAQVKAAQGGQHDELSQPVLKEIAIARNQLLDPKRKAEYDRQLKLRLRPEKALPPAAEPAGAVGTGPPRIGGTPTPEGSDAGSSTDRLRGGKPKKSRLVPIILGGIAGTLLAVAIIYVIRSRDVSTADRGPAPATDSRSPVSPAQAAPQASTPEESAAPAPAQRSESREEEGEETVQRPADPDLAVTAEPAEPSESHATLEARESRSGVDETRDPQAEEPAEVVSEPEPEPTRPDTRPQPKKPAVPDKASQVAAERRIREMFQGEFGAANTPDQRLALADKLFKLGRETTSDATGRFVLFRLACEITAGAGDLAKAMDVIDAIGQHYDADVLSRKADVLSEAVRSLRVAANQPQLGGQLLDTVMQFIDKAVADDRYDLAGRLCKVARIAARKANNFQVVRDLTAREREISRLAREYAKVKEVLDLLAKAPSNAEGNLAAGQWYCFGKGDWDKGLPLVAKGADAVLSSLAQRDLAQPDQYKAQLELAESWWRLGDNRPTAEKSQMRSRAAYWSDRAMPSLDQAVADDDYDVASRLVNLAIAAAREADNQTLTDELALRLQEIEQMKQGFATIRQALGSLAQDPGDAAANLTAGRWYCFDKGDWDKGLPLLTKGADPVLASLAARDLVRPEESKQQVQLADNWWSLGEKQQGPTKSAIKSRAGYWYEQAASTLSGLDKVRVQRRLESLPLAAEPSGSRSRGVVQPGNVALAGNGIKVTPVNTTIQRSELLFDGNTTEYNISHGYAQSKWPCEWIIVFDNVYRLQEIRFLLLDCDGRYYRYALAVSEDGNEYTVVADRSQGEWHGWQRITFSPRPVKSAKLVGLYNSANADFHLVEFEAYCIAP